MWVAGCNKINNFNGAVVAFKDITDIKNRELEITKAIASLDEIKTKGLQILKIMD